MKEDFLSLGIVFVVITSFVIFGCADSGSKNPVNTNAMSPESVISRTHYHEHHPSCSCGETVVLELEKVNTVNE